MSVMVAILHLAEQALSSSISCDPKPKLDTSFLCTSDFHTY